MSIRVIRQEFVRFVYLWFKWATKSPRRKIAALLLVTMFLDQFIYPIIPLLHPKSISANGSIEAVDIGPELFINRNPDFNVRFGDRTNPTKHKVIFESAGKELELRLLETQSLPIPASPSAVPQNELTAEITALQNQVGQVLGEVAQLSDQLRADLQKPNLISVEKPDGMADAIEQKIADRASIRYEILPNRGAKESIILSEAGATSNQLTFLMRLSPGIELHQQLENLNDTNIVASSQEPGASTSAQLTPNSQLLPPSPRYYFTDSNGKYLYHFEAPFMEDAALTRSTDVFYKIEKIDDASSFIQANSLTDFFPGNNYYKLTLIADPSWLADSARVYPVVIDPTIVHDTAPNFSSGTENRSILNSTSQVETQAKEFSADNSTLGLWHFNEGSSITAYDSSGNSKNGTLTNGPVWNGPIDTLVGLGKSNLSFDGTNDYVAVGALTSSAIVKSVEFWVYPKSTSTEFIDLNGSAYINASSGTVAATGFTSPTIYVNGVVSSTIVANQWQHIAVTTETALNASAANFGKRSTSYLNGYLDEVRISNKARTPEEIAASAFRFPYSVHESPVIDFGSIPNSLDSLTYSGSGIQTGSGELPYSTDGLVSAWNFNETSGTTAYNTAGADSCAGTPSACNLTLNNFASTSSQDQAAGTGWTANNKRFGAGAIMVASAATADTITVSNPASNALDPNSSDLTIETWVKTTDVTAELFSNNSNNAAACTSDGTYLGIDASGYPLFLLDTDGATAGCDVTINSGVTTKINDGNWHHLVAVVTRGVSGLLYMDGKVVGSDTAVTAYASETSAGSVQIASANNYDGVLDSIRFYSRALSESEIRSNSLSGLVEFQTRTGATATPNDGTWEAWKTTSGTGDTQIDALDNVIGVATPSASIWQQVPIATSSGTIKMEGANSLKIRIGAPQVEQNTVALWHLDETSSGATDIKDSSPNANNSTANSSSSTDGFFGKARSFNGTGDYVDFSSQIVPLGAKSVEFWIKTTTTSQSAVIVNSDGGTANNGTWIGVEASGVARFFSSKGTSGTPRFDFNSVATINNGKWHHVAMTWDGTTNANAAKVYIDGNLDNQGTAAATETSNATYNLRIACRNSGVSICLNGQLDEVKISNIARTADEVAEAYRAGRDHRLSLSLSSTDLSAKTKLPFYVASDRPGTYLSATVGESAYANYEPDANTAALWHLDEQTGTTNTYVKDGSGNANNSSAIGGTTYVQGVIGKARSFNNSASDYITFPDSTSLSITSTLTVDGWFYFNGFENYDPLIVKGDQGPTIADTSYNLIVDSAGTLYWAVNDDTNNAMLRRFSGINLTTGKWYHVAGTYDGGTSNTGLHIYINGMLADGTVDSSGSFAALRDTAGTISLGKMPRSGITDYMNGSVDEARISNSVRTADQIRQAYEIGKRTHPVTIDFKSTLDSTNLITNSTDYSFAIPATNSNINKGEKIIVKENVAGTEYIAQGTISAITYASGVSNPNAETQDKSTQSSVTSITVTSWDSGSTFPGSGFTVNSTVFKWQREYMDLTQIPLTTQRDAITRMTLRVTDGSQGATVYLDDIESADYSDGARATIGSTVARYFQYRAILTTGSSQLTPTLNSVTINYNSGTNPLPPKTKDSSTDFSATGSSNNRITDTGSSNSPQLELAYKELPTDINTVGLWHMNEASGNVADASGYGNTGTVTGTTVVSGRLNNGRSHNGTSSDYVSIPTSTNWAFGTKDFSLELWVKYNSLVDYHWLVGGASSNNFDLATYFATNRLYMYLGGTGYYVSWTPSTSQWYHLAVTKASGNLRFYVNGVQQGTDQSATASVAQQALVLGKQFNNSYYLNGVLDEVRISNIARTPEEIKLDAQRRPYGVYTSEVVNLGSNISSIDNLRWAENGVATGDGETPYSTNALVAQWNFNETSGTTAAVTSSSSCGSSCNGTLTTFASTASQDQAAGTGWTANNRRWGAGALMFDGTNDFVDVGSNMTKPSTFTIESWAKFTQYPTTRSPMLIMSERAAGDGITAWGWYFAGGGNWKQRVSNGSSFQDADSGIAYSATGLPPDSFIHLASTVDGTNIKMYKNGALVKTVSQTVANSGTQQAMAIGRDGAYGVDTYFPGIIDSTRIYSRALTAAEILSNYQAGNVELQTRTGTTTTPNDGTWEAWAPAGANGAEVQLDNLQTLSPVQKINTSNLVGYWKLDEVSGNRADSAGSNTLTDNATVTSKAGHLNLAGQFTAANSEYLSITDNTDVSTGNINFSVSSWVYLDSIQSIQPIIGKVDAAGTNREYDVTYRGTTNRFEFDIWASDGTYQVVQANNFGAATTGTWYFVTAWVDTTANTINIQVNNGAVDSATKTKTISDGNEQLRIGNTTGGGYGYWNGRIDEVAMWKRVLTADERKTLYEDGLDKTNDSVVGGINRTSDTTTKIEGTGSEKLTIGAPQVDSSTVALWHLDETSGTGAYIQDATANNNDGTPTGTSVVDGFYGKARSFNGTNTDYVSIGDVELVTGNLITVEAWAKLGTTQSAYGQIVGKTYIGFVYSLHIDETDTTKVSFGIDDWTDEAQSNSSLNDNKWHYLAGTYDGSTIRLYVDGVLQTQTGSTTINIPNTTDYLMIGCEGNGSTRAYCANGTIDEVRISNVARTADEIAEAYRAGRDHRLSLSLSSTDLSSKTKLPFYVAADRPGTYLQATVGESAFANYEPDTNTVGLWHLEEATGTTPFTKDSSGVGNNLTKNGNPVFGQGKIGKAWTFDGTGDYFSCTDANCGGTSKLDIGTGGFTTSGWFKFNATTSWQGLFTKDANSDRGWYMLTNSSQQLYFAIWNQANTSYIARRTDTYQSGVWYHIAVVYDGGQTATAIKIYLNGQQADVATVNDGGGTYPRNSGAEFRIGSIQSTGNADFNGVADEVTVAQTARTADEIRQAYEVGKRTHPITIDFVTSPQAAYSSGTSVIINNPSGTTNLTDTLSLGDTIIFKENVAGVETVSQSLVSNIVNSSSTYGTVTLLAAPTFPSGGFTTAATVFKWQREFFELSANLTNHRDAITRITLRVTDGNEGRNVWIDDFKAAGPYLTTSTTRTASITSTPQKYVQYRIIFSTTDTTVSPNVTSVTLQAHSGPMKVTGADTFTASGSFDRDGNVLLGSNNVKDVQFYDRTKDQLSYALNFDGSNDYVDIGTGPTSVKTVEFWVYPETTTEYFINLTSTTDYIWVNAGTVTATGFAAPIIYVNGVVSSTLVADQWQHVAVTDTTAENASNFDIGRTADANYLEGKIDEVALYDDVRTATEVASDYNARRLGTTDTNLVALYHFDEGSGTRAYDSDATFHGTLTNMALPSDNWVNSYSDRDQSALSQQVLGVDPNWPSGPARQSYALDFDGSSDEYVIVPDSTDWDFGGTFTIDFWVKFDTLTNGQMFVSQGQDTTHTWYAGKLTAAAGNKIEVYFIDTGGQYEFEMTNNWSDITTNQWYHVAIARSNATSTNYIYIDGVSQAITLVAGGNINTALEGSLYIGDYYYGAAPPDDFLNPLDGQMDEVRISNTVRYTTNFTPSRRLTEDANTKMLLHLDEGTGITVYDSSSNGHNGTLTNTPTWVTDSRAIMDNNARYIALSPQSSANNDKGLEIYAVSTTQFKYRWTGDQVWSSALNFSSYPFATPAQLGTTGVYVGFDTTNGTFGDESYFLIPSWAIQQFSAYRGTRRSFPERSYLVATDKGLDIIDADDNTLWMRTENGPGRSLATFTNNVPSNVYMTQGQLFIGTNGSAATGLYRFDFNRDKIYRYDATNRTTNTVNIAKRNTTDSSYGSADTNQKLQTSVVNDVNALVTQGQLMLATANSTGLTKSSNIQAAATTYMYSDVTSDAYQRVRLAENFSSGSVGDMYALNTTQQQLERWNNVIDDAASELNGTPDVVYDQASTPALFATAQTVNDLDINIPTITVAHAAGTTVISENRTTQASGSVKYYTKDYITEEMIGNTSGMWPLTDANDASFRANNMTNNGSVTFSTSGIRGKTAHFTRSSSQYLSKTDNASLSLGADVNITIAAWVKLDSKPAGRMEIVGKGDNNVGSDLGVEYRLFWDNTDDRFEFEVASASAADIAKSNNFGAPSTGTWYFVVGWHDATGNTVNIQVNNGTADSTAHTTGTQDRAEAMEIGNMSTVNQLWDGSIDEIFITKEALSSAQKATLYAAGKEALTNKRRTTTALDTLNQLAGTISVSTAVAATNQNLYVGTNTTGADDGFLSRILLRGDTRDREYDESTTDPILTDNDINSVSVSSDGAYIVVGTDDQGITVIQNGSTATRLRSGGRTQGPMKRPLN